MKTTRKRRWPWILLCTAVVLVLLVIAGGGWYLVNYALDTQSPGAMCNTSFRVPGEDLTEEQQWLTSRSEDLYMDQKGTGLKLHAYYMENPEPNGRYAVLCHGYSANALSVYGFARHYYEQGYHILMPDAMSHGLSEGRYVGMGWPERLDVVRWIEQLAEKDPQADIILHGISMGGATVMMVSGEKLPGNVKAIVEDCGYTSVWDEFSWQLKQIFGLPEFPLLHAASGIAKLRTGNSFTEASAVEQVRKSVTPTLFIHGSADTFVPFAMLDRVYEAAACEKEKLVIEDAIHGAASAKDPELYWQTVDAFVEKYIR